MLLQVKDWDRVGTHSSMGTASISLDKIKNSRDGVVMDSLKLKGAKHGFLHVILTYRPF